MNVVDFIAGILLVPILLLSFFYRYFEDTKKLFQACKRKMNETIYFECNNLILPCWHMINILPVAALMDIRIRHLTNSLSAIPQCKYTSVLIFYQRSVIRNV